MKGRILSFFGLLTVFSALFVAPIYAQTITPPSFPSCTNPQGSILAQYDSGVHGIAGDESNHTGSDSVYAVSDNAVLQCYCSGKVGVQTNWWKVSDLSQQQIDQFEKEGWTYVPDGADWGLANTPYLALNISLNCNSSGNFSAQNTVLGTSATDAITYCGRCIWLPILLGEIALLLLFYMLMRRRKMSVLARYVPGGAVGLLAYVVFVLINGGKCPFGVMDFKFFTIPCVYFWAVDGVTFMVISFLFRPRKSSPTKK